ncbi:MAG TPA: division/cell wall cluster transcriptional repressor MraZ [Anaerolineae bacterium]|nr:division/cell wall cluster transcriptional repressor MraZ [Anaerolineae bacterium]
MFLGEFKHTVDSKGRLTIPAKFRPQLAAGVVITRGIDRCLFLFSMAEWEKLSQQVSQLPITQQEAREFRRLIFSGASDVVPDKQGRILIPSYLREYANLDSEVVIVGNNTYIEIWNAEAWQEAKANIEGKALNAEYWAILGI